MAKVPDLFDDVPDLFDNAPDLGFEQNYVNENKQKEAVSAVQQIQVQQEQQRQADPNNWTLEQTKEHYKQNPPQTPQDEFAKELLLKQKKDVIKQQIDRVYDSKHAELKAGPPPTIKDGIKDLLSKFGIVESPEQRRAKAEIIQGLSHVYDLDMATIEKNYDSLSKGINRDPRLVEMIGAMTVPAITAGVALHPAGLAMGLLSTGAGLAAFQGLSEIENAAVSAIKKEKYKFLRGRQVKDLLPEEASQGTKDMVELLDFVGKGLASAKVMQQAPVLAQRFTKDLVTSYKLPEKVYISSDKLGKMNQETFQNYFQKDLGLSNAQVKELWYAKNEGKAAEVEIPAEKIVTLVDKPGWAWIKNKLNIKSEGKVLSHERATQAIAKRETPKLEGPKESTVTPSTQQILTKGKLEDVGNNLENIKPELLSKEPQLKALVDESKVYAQKAKDAQALVNDDVFSVAQELQLTQQQRAQEKSLRSIVSKVLRKQQDNPNYSLKDVTDYGRGTIIVDDFNTQAVPAVKSLVDKGWKVDPKFGKEVFGGFRIMSLTKTQPNGITTEMQLSDPSIWKLKKEYSDKIYHDYRDLIEKDPRKMTPEEIVKFKTAHEESKAKWKPIYDRLDLDRVSNEAISSGVKTTASLVSDNVNGSVLGNGEPSSLNTLTGNDLKSTTLPDSNLSTKSDITQPPVENVTDQSGNVNSKERKFITTVREAPQTRFEVSEKVSGNYTPITNKETMAAAQEFVANDYNKAVELVNGPEKPTAFSNAVAIELMRVAQQEYRIMDAVLLAEKTAAKQTELGQAIQALSMYERLSPEGILLTAKRAVNQAREAIKQPEKLKNFDKLSKGLNEIDKDKLAKKLGVPHISEEVARQLTEMAKRIQDMPPGYEKSLETAKMLKKIADIVPPSLGQRVSIIQTMAQLLNPKTMVRNFLGNVGFQATEGFSDVIATGLDIATSLRTGKRTVFLTNPKLQVKGAVQGFKEGVKESLAGVDLRGQDQSKFTLPKNGVFNKGVLGALEKTLRISLGATDRAFYQAAFNQSIQDQMKSAKARGIDLKEPTEEMIEEAHRLGLYRTFQDDNVISRQFVNLKKWFNVNKQWGLGDMILKYPKTPANILARGIEYSPFGFIKTVVELAKPLMGKGFNQEAFVRGTARAFTGSTFQVGLGMLLAGLGIITGKRSSDKDVNETRENVGLRNYQINTSALKRFVMSGFDPDQAKLQEDDQLVSYDWMLPASIGVSLGANMVLDPKTNLVDKSLNLAERMAQASETLQEQPLVQGVKRFSQTRNAAEGLTDMTQQIPASFIPTILNQVRQLTDNTARNTQDINWFKEAYNKTIVRVPGMSKQLPPRISTLGEPKEMYQGGTNNPFNVFLNPAFVNRYKPDPVSKMVLDIWEKTGSREQFPRVVPNKIDTGRGYEELSVKKKTEYQKYIGQRTTILYKILADKPSWQDVPDDKKAKILSNLLSDINTAAKIEILGYQPKRVDKDVRVLLKGMGKDILKIKQQAPDLFDDQK